MGDTSKTKTIHIGLTGHRPHKLWGYDLDQPEYDNLQAKLENVISTIVGEYDEIICHSGLALGADTIWSIAILNMREKYPSKVKFHAEIPFMGQASSWFSDSEDFWKYQLETADSKTLYLEHEDDNWKTVSKWVITKALDDRNRGMVDSVDILIAITDGSKSGTKNAIDYAKKKSKYLLTYHPNEFKK